MLFRYSCTLRNLARGFAAVFLLAISGSCGGSDSGPDFGTNDPELIVAMGDSITFGLYDVGVADCSESYRNAGGFCPRVQALSGKTVINEGVCGASSFDGVARVQSILQRYGPGVLLIDYSPNDMWYGTSESIANLRSMIGAAISNKTVPVVGTLIPATGEHRGWEPFIESVNERIRDLCQELDVECADHYEAFKQDPGYEISPYALLSSDGLHPNASGFEVMARTWNDALRKVY
jgi:lysophospholipase L1-like esterase